MKFQEALKLSCSSDEITVSQKWYNKQFLSTNSVSPGYSIISLHYYFRLYTVIRSPQGNTLLLNGREAESQNFYDNIQKHEIL